MVIDDRPELLNRDCFPEPITLKLIGSFDQACSGLTIDRDCYLVILSRSHSLDKLVLCQALRTDAAYLGMIGSQRKRDTIFQSVLNEGFSKEDLEKVHSPIGLEIGADTPEEIAVSIIAQLIQVRSDRLRTLPASQLMSGQPS
jgi:xanthine dehydrogenase accessory factor